MPISPPGRNTTTRTKSVAEDEQRLLERSAQDARQRLHRVRATDDDEPLVGVHVQKASEQRAAKRPAAAEHDHHEQRKREVGRGDADVRAADDEQVDDTAGRRQRRAHDEGQQLVPACPEAEHLDPALVLTDGLPDVARRGTDGPADDQRDGDGIAEREPVQVAGVDHADEG